MASPFKSDVERLVAEVMRSVSVPRSMAASLAMRGHELQAGPARFDLRLFDRAMLVAIGKAAVPMVEQAIATLQGAVPLTGLVVGPGDWTGTEHVLFLRGDHPVPHDDSFAAGRELLQLVRDADEKTLVLFLISGGASAMAEVRLDESIPLSDITTLYERLLHAGLPIEKTNTVRKHFSAIKGGRLALAAGAATRCTLLISDVPAGKLDVVGSGPSLPDSSTVAECLQILRQMEEVQPLPKAIWRFAAAMQETPKMLPEGVQPSVCVAVLSSDSLIRAATRILQADGFRVVVDNGCDDWDYRDAARYLVDRAVQESNGTLPVCVLSAGEITVTIGSAKHGTGGRNQQWALEAARLLRGKSNSFAMSFGSDGVDGNSPAAGAVVDATTWQRVEDMGLSPAHALKSFDAWPLFAALGDAIAPGPSANNIRDLRAIFVLPKVEDGTVSYSLDVAAKVLGKMC